MRWGLFTRVVFILYCLEAGVFLLLAPWSPAWDRAWLQLEIPRLYFLFRHPAVRGAVTGFGLVHLVWSAHDLDRLLSRRRWREAPPA